MDYIFILEKKPLGVGVLYQPKQVDILRCVSERQKFVQLKARYLRFVSTDGNIDHTSKSLRGFE